MKNLGTELTKAGRYFLFVFFVLIAALFPEFTAYTADENEGPATAPKVSEEELERAVIQRSQYIDRLLNKDAAKKIELSGNKKAKAALERARVKKDIIDRMIAERRFSEAFEALHELHPMIMEALKIATQKEEAEERMRNKVEEAKIADNLYLGYAGKLIRQNKDIPSIIVAQNLIETAKAMTDEAVEYHKAGEFEDALIAYSASIRLLKKAVRLIKKERKIKKKN